MNSSYKIEKLSAIIIAKNEENNIKRCLDSLTGCIDDIVVVVDKSSTDNTLTVVQGYNVNCIESEWLGYSKTKTLALENTQHNWVLWIDADECLTEDLKNELISLKNSETEFAVYKIARRAFFLGRWIPTTIFYPYS